MSQELIAKLEHVMQPNSPLRALLAAGDMDTVLAVTEYGGGEESRPARDLLAKAQLEQITFAESIELMEMIFIAGYRAGIKAVQS